VATIAKVTHVGPDIDTDGFPLFPPLTGGREVPVTARSLARLVASLTSGVLTTRTEDVAAMVLFVDRQPVDGMALRGGRRVTGPDALDEIADVSTDQLSYRELPPEVAGVLGSYFLPTEVREVPAAMVVPEAFIRSLARPDGRGCVLLRAGTDTGFVFIAAGQVVLALRPDAGRVGGLEVVAELLADPQARLWARLGPLREVHPSPDRQAAAEPTIDPPPPASPQTSTRPAEPGMDQPLEQILEGVRQRLGRHSVAIESIFREAPRTDEGLRAAAESVRGLRIRLVSPTTLASIADDALTILGRGS